MCGEGCCVHVGRERVCGGGCCVHVGRGRMCGRRMLCACGEGKDVCEEDVVCMWGGEGHVGEEGDVDLE